MSQQYYTCSNNLPIDPTFILDRTLRDAIEINPSLFQVPSDGVIADIDLPSLKEGEIYIVEFETPEKLTVSQHVKVVKDWRNRTVYHKTLHQEMVWKKVKLDDEYTDQKPIHTYQKFDEKQKLWTDDELKIDQLKEAKRQEINEARTNAELEGFTFNGKPFDSDRDSISRIGNAATAAQSALLMKQPFQVDWVTKDNESMQLDAQGILMMHGALVQHVDQANAKAQSIKKKINSATTIAELLEIKWDE